MSDNDDLDIDGGEAPEGGSTFKKKSALGAILPTILKFAAIGLGAMIFIVTVVVITMNIRDGGGRAPDIDPESPFVGAMPVLSWFSEIGTISAQTRDTPSHTVSVVMQLGFDQGDTTTSSELFGRTVQLQAFTRHYFALRTAEELRPGNESALRREIRDILNTRYLTNGRVRDVVFTRLDVMEAF
ncbi:MAG: flagellar basal body protein FliL [Treponema sp.]|nr:flagellar basal body protein FliL [Treponema sp.]